jgi:hypothetical protein
MSNLKVSNVLCLKYTNMYTEIIYSHFGQSSQGLDIKRQLFIYYFNLLGTIFTFYKDHCNAQGNLYRNVYHKGTWRFMNYANFMRLIYCKGELK